MLLSQILQIEQMFLNINFNLLDSKKIIREFVAIKI